MATLLRGLGNLVLHFHCLTWAVAFISGTLITFLNAKVFIVSSTLKEQLSAKLPLHVHKRS